MANMDNPAGLLRYWLEKLEGQDKSQALSVAVCQMFDLNHESLQDRAEVLGFGAGLAGLCEQTRRETEQLPKSLLPELLLADFAQVETAVDHFTMARQQPVEAVFRSMDAAAWRGLEVLDNFLHLNRPQHQIDESARQSLLEQLRDLIDGVAGDADLPANVKAVVLDRLLEVEKALRLANITGAAAVERATESLIGSWRNPVKSDLWKQVGQTTWGPRIGRLAITLCLALGAANDGIQLMSGDSPIPIEYNITINEDDGHPDLEVERPDPGDDVVEAVVTQASETAE